jgi:hypothetical protein
MKTLPIKMERELVPVIVILFLFCVSMVANFVLNKKIEIKYGHLIDVKIEKLHTLHLLTEDISNRQRYMINMLLVSDEAAQTDLQKKVKESQMSSDKLLDYLSILYDEQGESKLMQPLREQYHAYLDINTVFTETVLKGKRDKAIELNVSQMRPIYESIQTNLRDLSNVATEKAEQIAKDATADIDFARKVILFIGLLPFGIWLVMLLWVFSYLGWQKLAGPRDDF